MELLRAGEPGNEATVIYMYVHTYNVLVFRYIKCTSNIYFRNTMDFLGSLFFREKKLRTLISRGSYAHIYMHINIIHTYLDRFPKASGGKKAKALIELDRGITSPLDGAVFLLVKEHSAWPSVTENTFTNP